MNDESTMPDGDDSWARVELWRWQYGELPQPGDNRPLDVAAGLKGMAAAIGKNNEANFPSPSNVIAVLQYAAKVIDTAPKGTLMDVPDKKGFVQGEEVVLKGIRFRVTSIAKRTLKLKVLMRANR